MKELDWLKYIIYDLPLREVNYGELQEIKKEWKKANATKIVHLEYKSEEIEIYKTKTDHLLIVQTEYLEEDETVYRVYTIP